MRPDGDASHARTPPRGEAGPWWKWIALAIAVLVISTLHYLTPPAYAHWHLVYQRLYYLPILFGAFWYGLSGGLIVAVVTSVLYLPHIVLHWGHDPLYRSNQLADILLFVVIGAVSGLLIDTLRREREKQRRTAEELARAYEQLQATFERLRLLDRLSALGTLSAGMAHEIKNPLGAILGSIEILETNVPEGDERREFVLILKKEIQRLSSIVNDHLDLVRPGQPQRGPHDLGEIVRSVVELTRTQAEKQGVELTQRVPGDLPTVMVDGQQLRQAVLNLVINAIQALPRGGRVTASVEQAQERLRIVVEDDGPGLGDEALRRAFEPFYTTKEGGTGLGLSIAFQIADRHGGDLRVRNRPAGGAALCLEIPIVDAAATPEEVPA
jgi:signal transduction histidine kinase